ncbi:MAG: NAD(P)/FAD-dependent oxidoreductase [Spirochaetales bacterium]|nr:NAD(P)/FAD-dependent oxidoreductase [Spirochaetales bacterium]
MTHKIYDCVIVGAGCAGSVLAKKIAEAGFSVALLDKRSGEKIGHPWEVAIEKSIFGRVGMKFPDSNLWEENPDVSRYYAKDINNYIQIDASKDDGLFIRHRRINQSFLNAALNAGIHFMPGHFVTAPEITDDFVTGVSGFRRSLLGKRPFLLNGRVIIDASGITSVIRKKLPDNFNIKKELRNQDFACGWNEVREVNDRQISQLADRFEMVPGMSYTRIGKYHAYEVIHLRRNHTVNLIFGTVYDKTNRSAKPNCDAFITKHPYFGRKIYGGGNIIPLRRAIDSMVGNGFLVIGDAACQVIPTMGSGVASAIHAADIALNTICEALNRGRYTREGLWTYNHKYQSKRGAILASYDIVRRFLQYLELNEINEVFRAGLLRDENFINTFSSNVINFDIMQILDNFGKILTHLNLLPLGLKFIQVFRDSQRALNIYKKYPSAYNESEFSTWVSQTNALFSHYRTFDKEEIDPSIVDEKIDYYKNQAVKAKDNSLDTEQDELKSNSGEQGGS